MSTSNKLELPTDVGRKIMSMLKQKARPECVLLFTTSPWKELRYKTGTLTDEERDFLVPDATSIEGQHADGIQVVSIPSCYGPLIPITYSQAALLIGFRFQDETARERSKNGKDFEMYRDAIHSIA
jgi:hypothetical protein